MSDTIICFATLGVCGVNVAVKLLVVPVAAAEIVNAVPLVLIAVIKAPEGISVPDIKNPILRFVVLSIARVVSASVSTVSSVKVPSLC